MRLLRTNSEKLVVASVAGAIVAVPSLAVGAQPVSHGPSNAPIVEIGRARTVSHSGRDYWRVPLAASDQLAVVGFTPISADGTACIFAPGITNANVKQRPCVLSVDVARAANPGTGMASEFGWPESHARGVGIAGDWVLAFARKGCPTCEFTYRFFVRVLRGTTTTLQAPRVAISGRTFVLRGRVRSAEAGSATVSRRTGRRWKAIGTAYVDQSGKFTLRTKVLERGAVAFRARYSGDDFHRESTSRTVVVRVR
jgi:hypothetical protein